MPNILQGVLPIVQTPFTDDDTIDWAALQREIDWAFDVGADGLGTGMVSETLKLTADERIELAGRLVEGASGRGSVFVSVGAESTAQACWFAEAAARAGCDAVMAVPPISTALSDAHLEEYFATIAGAIEIPLIVQDASGYVGQRIPLSVCVHLLERFGPERILFKPEAAPLGPNLSALRDATGGKARIFEGSGGVALVDAYRRGIVGTMPGMDMLDGMVALWNALRRNDEAEIYRLYLPICALAALQMQAGLDGFLAVEKHLLVKRGIFASARRRYPYRWEMDAETTAEVDRLHALLQAAK
jgi:4-hydroxy-tetrahydrodipicolinate synthase